MSLASDINDLLSSLVSGRVYPVLAPQGVTRPYVVWRRAGGDPLATLNSGATTAREIVVVLIGGYAETFDEADDLAGQIRAAVLAGTSAMRGKSVKPPHDGYEPETRLFSVVLEATLFHRT